MATKKRTLAFIMAIVIVFVMLFSVFFITRNATHCCAQDGCPICQQLEFCENALYGMVAIAAACVLFLFPLTRCDGSVSFRPSRISFHTLVSLKVKLSN